MITIHIATLKDLKTTGTAAVVDSSITKKFDSLIEKEVITGCVKLPLGNVSALVTFYATPLQTSEWQVRLGRTSIIDTQFGFELFLNDGNTELADTMEKIKAYDALVARYAGVLQYAVKTRLKEMKESKNGIYSHAIG